MLVNKSKSIRVQVRKRRANVSEMAQRTRNSWAYCPESINHTYNNVNSVVKMRQSTWKDTSHTWLSVCLSVCVPIYISTCVCMYLYVYQCYPLTDVNIDSKDPETWNAPTIINRDCGWVRAERRRQVGNGKADEMYVCLCVCSRDVGQIKTFHLSWCWQIRGFRGVEHPFCHVMHNPKGHTPATPAPPTFSCDTFALPTYYTQESICGAKFYNEANAPADYRLNK